MRIHRNLHNARRGGPQWIETKGGRKVAELDSVVLANVSTRIRPATRARCETDQVRSVCAFFDGDQIRPEDLGPNANWDNWHLVAFDPRKNSQFLANGEPWTTADYAVLRADGSTYVLNPKA